MTKNQDYTAVFKDMMSAFPVDNKAMDDMFKAQSAHAEKLSAVAIDSLSKSSALSTKWTQDSLAKLSALASAKAEPADRAKLVSDFFSASAEAATSHLTALADIAKQAQAQSLELIMAAGKDTSEDLTAAAKKAQGDLTAAVEKAQTAVASATKTAAKAA